MQTLDQANILNPVFSPRLEMDLGGIVLDDQHKSIPVPGPSMIPQLKDEGMFL
jgi:hypothetical protein